jgi:hypothetical protein
MAAQQRAAPVVRWAQLFTAPAISAFVRSRRLCIARAATQIQTISATNEHEPTLPEDAYHASRRRSDRIRLPPGCRSDRSHDYPFGFFLQDCDVLSASKAVRCARKETSIFPHQIGAGRIDRTDFQDWCLKPLGQLSGSHSIASRTHPLQALRSSRHSPQESLKISMRCSPFAKTLDWLGGRSAVS